MDTPEVRDRLHDLAARLRTDETLVIPMGEGNLASPSRLPEERQVWPLAADAPGDLAV